MEENRIVLGSLRYKSASDKDVGLQVDLNQSQKELMEFEPNTNVNLPELFDIERQESTIFRPSAKIVLLFENQYSGITNYKQFKNHLYYVNEEFYAQQQAANPGGSIPWGGYPQYSEFSFIRSDFDVVGYTTPPNEHVNFLTKNAYRYNWDVYLSYAFSGYNRFLRYDDKTPTGSVNTQSWFANEGIPFTVLFTDNNGYNLITLRCAIDHGVSVGEYVELTNESGVPMTYQGSNVYQVHSLGNGLYDSEKYYINIYDFGILPSLGSPFLNGQQGTLKRIINIENSGETKSKYYVRRHKLLTNFDDSIINRAGFELNAFNQSSKYVPSALTPNSVAKIVTKTNNESYIVTFSKDVDITSLLDNNGQPIRELFFTIIHKGFFGWFYDPPLAVLNSVLQEGYVFNMTQNKPPNFCPTGTIIPSNWWQKNNVLSYSVIPAKSYVKNGLTFYYNDSLKADDIVDGDFCEWNDFEQKERLISNYIHKITFNNVAFNNNPTPNSCSPVLNPKGYYYMPHYPVKIRQYSDYIEEGDPKNTDLIPQYAFYSSYRKLFRWRDIYTYGFVDSSGNGVSLPFLNGVHHPYLNILFRLIPEGYDFSDLITDINEPTEDDCE